ncbi:MAG: hypothetical protein JSV95_09910 [Gemmatimonadota bacterium]|jgi:hypothetical protein|nr:MAG: hypothetical protein JSV95_09910 [Gemmatimonadota bacterium]
MTEILGVLAFAGLFALFGALRPRAGCSGDPAGCDRCDAACTIDIPTDGERERSDPHLEVHR